LRSPSLKDLQAGWAWVAAIVDGHQVMVGNLRMMEEGGLR
jgi:hypothetical protein